MGKGRKTFRKVITSPELIEQINNKNKILMERFLKNFATKHSPASTVVYRSNLNIFMCYNILFNDNIEFTKLKKRDFMEFFDYCVSELQWGSQRFHQMHSALSSFSTFIENYYDDVYEDFRNLLPKIEKPVKDAVRKKTILQKDDIDKIFGALEEEGKIQEQCLLALAISCGARISELARFTTNLIDENNTVFDDLFLETTEEIRTKGRGVNGKMLTKYILKDTFLPYYNKWLELRKEIMEENEKSHNYIFITRDGNPASDERLRDWMSNWSKIVDQPCYPHNFRHYNISMYKRIGIEDDLIVFLTGWAEGTGHGMISIYNDNTLTSRKFKGLDKLKNALEQGNA